MLAVLGGLMFADLAAASQQQQPFYWWRSEEFRKELGLTAEQSAKIDGIHQSTLPELRQEWDELNKYEAKLSKLLESSTDEALLARQIDRVETARANLNKTRSLMIARIRLVLNAEQRARFKVLADRRAQQNGSSDSDSRRRQEPGKNNGQPDSGSSNSSTRPGR
jgi:Spy/CpxP family protein refolding chaperone